MQCSWDPKAAGEGALPASGWALEQPIAGAGWTGVRKAKQAPSRGTTAGDRRACRDLGTVPDPLQYWRMPILRQPPQTLSPTGTPPQPGQRLPDLQPTELMWEGGCSPSCQPSAGPAVPAGLSPQGRMLRKTAQVKALRGLPAVRPLLPSGSGGTKPCRHEFQTCSAAVAFYLACSGL